jgi:hypothetical protein
LLKYGAVSAERDFIFRAATYIFEYGFGQTPFGLALEVTDR